MDSLLSLNLDTPLRSGLGEDVFASLRFLKFQSALSGCLPHRRHSGALQPSDVHTQKYKSKENTGELLFVVFPVN